MLGILDFEKKLAEISDTELLPHLSLELSRIPWSEERDHLIPKFSRDQIKFKYKDDFISDFLIKQQERAQDVTSRFSKKFGIISSYYSKIEDKVEVSANDKQLLPTVLLSSFAAFVSYRSRPDSLVVSKLVHAASGAVVCSLICYERFRREIGDRIKSIIPVSITNQFKKADMLVGQYGADIWIKATDFIDLIKNKVTHN